MVALERYYSRFAARSRSYAVPGHAALLIAVLLIAACTTVTDTGPGQKPVFLSIYMDPAFQNLPPRTKSTELTFFNTQKDELSAADALTRKGYVKIGTVSGRSVYDPSLYSTVSAEAAQKGGDVVLLGRTEKRADTSTTRTTPGTGEYYKSGDSLIRGSSSTQTFGHYTYYNYTGSVWRHDPARAAAKIELLEGLVDPARLERFLNSEAGRSAGLIAKDLNDLIGKHIERVHGRSFKLLVKAGAHPRLTYGSESLPLMAIAIHKGNVELVQALLDAGEPFPADGMKFSCTEAISFGFLQFDYQCSSSPDFAAIASGNPKMLELVAKRSGVRFQGAKGYQNPLQYAALLDQPVMIEKLLQMAGNGYKRNDLNYALWTAVTQHSVNAVSMLLRKGADPNAKVENQVTILMRAIEDTDYVDDYDGSPNLRIINMLLDAGANPNCAPLARAVSKFRKEGSIVVKALRDRRAKPCSP